jgi:hypothetical protein
MATIANQRQKESLLEQWAYYLGQNARGGELTGGRACAVTEIDTIAGPRVGALEIYAGLDSGRLMKSLTASQCAGLRQLVPWQFIGEPQCFMRGRYVRVEAGWPRELATSMIRLRDISGKPDGRHGTFVAGMSEDGSTVVPVLDDRTPHFLVSGATGSGKSVTLRSIALQLSADPACRLVLLDGKFGDSLRPVERLSGVVGPCAVDVESARNALGWAHSQMTQRYQSGHWQTRIIVMIDEVQEFIEDRLFVALLQKLTAQGRGAQVHCLVGTQHPTVDSFGDNRIRRALLGKIALLVDDPDASRVAVGGKLPRADHLLGTGDSYTISPSACHRVQIAYADDEIEDSQRGWWEFPRWPAYEAEIIDGEEQVNWSYSGKELAVSLVSATHGEGRPAMVRRLEESELGRPGAERAIRLLNLGREEHSWLVAHEYAVCLSGNGHKPHSAATLAFSAPETVHQRTDRQAVVSPDKGNDHDQYR